jgi:hypothetical protein
MPIAAIFATIGAETVALTAAEVAAAEAAKIAAAEAAAAVAAEAAAATAAQQAATTAAQQAATTTAQQAATSTAANVGGAEALNLAAQQQAAQQAGIMGVEGAAANAPLTAEAVQSAAMNSGQGLANPALAAPPPSAPYSPLNVGSNPSAPFAEYFGQQAGQQAGIANPALASQPPMGIEGQIPANQFIEPGSGGIYSLENTMAQANVAPPPPSALETGMDKAIKFAEKNPFTAMTGAYMGANALGLMNPSGNTFNNDKYSGPLSKYRLSPDFRSSNVNPADFQYTPRRYAEGGVMGMGAMPQQPRDIQVGYNKSDMAPEVSSYAKGGSLSDSIEKYQKMMDGETKAAPTRAADVGIYYDQDPDTRYQDALTAAQIRQAKINQRAYVSPPAAKRPTPMGQLQMASVKAAQGGIMQSSLGGYAAGGNPRLLKGPGDGMSDNIPATINGRQPARLADGEFVIPADVVSHLGNGSTEAGAKQLHAMMNKIRKARTGNPKQGKQINPSKFLPK